MLSATQVLCGPASNNWAECKLLHTDPIMKLIIKTTLFSAFSFSSLINKPMAQDGSTNRNLHPYGPTPPPKPLDYQDHCHGLAETRALASPWVLPQRMLANPDQPCIAGDIWRNHSELLRMFDDVCIPCLLVRIVGIVQKCRLLGGSDPVWTREKLLATLKRQRWKVHESPVASRNPKSL